MFVTELERHLPFFNERHRVKPGLSGWAQINHEYTSTIEDTRIKLEYDMYYLKNWSLFLDFLILAQTVRVGSVGQRRSLTPMDTAELSSWFGPALQLAAFAFFLILLATGWGRARVHFTDRLASGVGGSAGLRRRCGGAGRWPFVRGYGGAHPSRGLGGLASLPRLPGAAAGWP